MRVVLVALAMLCVLAAPAAAFEEEVIEIVVPGTGTILRVWVIYPDEYDPAKPTPTLLTFPPGGQDLVMVDYSFNWWGREAIKRGWLLLGAAAPPAAQWPYLARDLLGFLMQSLLERYNVEGGKFHLAGFHTGGTSVFAAALGYPELVRSMTAIPGMLPAKEDAALLGRLKGIPVTMFVGETDTQFVGPMRALQEQLTKAGATSTLEVIPSAGQELTVFRDAGAAVLFDRMALAR